LVDVLKAIGGKSAEALLAEMLRTTPRAIEVAYIAQVLETMAPGKYTALSLAAAKRFLSDKTPAAGAGPLDENGSTALYALLSAHNDDSEAAAAKARLVVNGKMDMAAAKYLITALKGEGVAELAKIYPTASPEDKNRINGLTFPYVGATPEANQIFKDWVLDNKQDPAATTLNAKPRSLYVQMLCGGSFGPFQADVPTNREVISSRINLLKEMDLTVSEPRLKQAIAQSLQCLQGR
jgi:hypothetical protein